MMQALSAQNVADMLRTLYGSNVKIREIFVSVTDWK